MADQVLFDFTVPDELLQEALSTHRDQAAVADVAMMPGTGEGKAPPLIGILRSYGYAPLVLLTAAAMVPGTFGNGIAIIGKNLEASFHIHNTALAAVAFVAQVAQLLWAVPLALLADRGSRKVVAAGGAVRLRHLRLADGALAQRVGLRLLVPGGLGGLGGEQHRPQLVPVRRLPDREPGAHLQLAQPGHTALGHGRDPLLRLHRHRRPQLALRPAGGPGRHPPRLRPPHHHASPTRGPTRPATSSSPRAWTSSPSRRRRPGCSWGRRSPACCGSGPSTTS